MRRAETKRCRLENEKSLAEFEQVKTCEVKASDTGFGHGIKVIN